MASQYPKCWAYLESRRAKLEARSVQSGSPETWYRYGRSQSLAKLDDEKIIVRVLSVVPQYAWDPGGLLVPGGGDGGPYYLIRPLPGSSVSALFLIGVLSHPVIDAMVWEAGGKEYRGGYFPHRKAFLKTLPIPTSDAAGQARVTELTTTLVGYTEEARSETDARTRTVLDRRTAAQRARVEAAVGELLGLTEEDTKAVVGE
jgi:hypothetical protein